MDRATCEQYVSGAARYYSSPSDLTLAECIPLEITEV